MNRPQDQQLREKISFDDLICEAPSAPITVAPWDLGLFSRMVAKPCLLEFFQSPTKLQIRTCLAKFFRHHEKLLRQAKRQKRPLPESSLPHLWIVAATVSPAVIRGLDGTLLPEWGDGIYFLGGKALKSALVVIDELPRTSDTLYLRIIGRGPIQKQAVEELIAAPDSPMRNNIIAWVFQFYVKTELQTTLTEEDKELLMNISPIYLEARQRAVQEGIQLGIQQGIQQGRIEGQRLLVEHLLRSRFGELANTLSNVVERMILLPTEEIASLLLQASREELMARFNGGKVP